MESPDKKIELTEAQQLAVKTVGRNVCVSAGAGSGKTAVLVERFIHLVKERGLSCVQILAITFTERAANEMKKRIVDRLREENLDEARREVENAAIGTIHAFSARLLREHPVEAGVDPHFVIFEEEEATRLKGEILDQTVEASAADPEIFDFLRTYGEESVRRGILKAYDFSRNTETPLKELLDRRAKADRKFFESDLKKGLQKISAASGALEVAARLGEIFPQENLDWEGIGEITGLKKKLRAQGKQKEDIRFVQELLLDFAAFLAEEKSLPERGHFIRLTLDFEKGYGAAKQEKRALDFDDLQLAAVRLLGSETAASRETRKIYREKFREIMVDEFQDTNRLQDRLLELLRGEANLFVVGDLKQSIYAFRGTRVEIFLEKEKLFQESPKGARVPLVENHRARPKLIQFLNRFFEILWREDGIPFEPLRAVREEEEIGPRVERFRLEKSREEDADDIRIREARALAVRIRELHENEGVPYKDIACLFEAMSHSHFYEQEFRRAGIPYFVVSNRGFYAQLEIRDLLSFLAALENPKHDAPLAATLRSPLFQISDDTLFWLARKAKEADRETPLADGFWNFESIAEIPDTERQKLRFFKETLERFLAQKERLRISELIEGVLRATDYDLYVLRLRHGERRFANLKKLIEIAREMEAKEPLHLGDFVRAVKNIESREVRESQAQVEAEEGEVVRLMSIHAAKGLEFPVVVLPDLGRKDNQTGGHFSISEEEGLGLRAWNASAYDFEETLTWSRNRRRQDRADSEESKRLLYVAMTRTEERLVLSGPAEKDKEPKGSFHEMSSWAEWVETILGQGEWEMRLLAEPPREAFPFEKRKALAERRSIRSRLQALEPVRLRKVPEGVEEIFGALSIPEKTDFERIDLPVSAFLLFSREPEAYFATYELGIPSGGFQEALPELKEEEPPVTEEELSAAEFGTRVHRLLEQILLGKIRESGVDSLVVRLNRDLRTDQQKEIAELGKNFLKSPEAGAVLSSRTFYPELPFALRLPHGIIQGTLDLIYQNQAGEWTILDYKTSRVDEKNFMVRGEEYRIQLELYALAVSQILGHPPKEGQVYFLRPGLVHRIPFTPDMFVKFSEKFTDLQKEILKFRRQKLATGISLGKS